MNSFRFKYVPIQALTKKKIRKTTVTPQVISINAIAITPLGQVGLEKSQENVKLTFNNTREVALSRIFIIYFISMSSRRRLYKYQWL